MARRSGWPPARPPARQGWLRTAAHGARRRGGAIESARRCPPRPVRQQPVFGVAEQQRAPDRHALRPRGNGNGHGGPDCLQHSRVVGVLVRQQNRGEMIAHGPMRRIRWTFARHAVVHDGGEGIDVGPGALPTAGRILFKCRVARRDVGEPDAAPVEYLPRTACHLRPVSEAAQHRPPVGPDDYGFRVDLAMHDAVLVCDPQPLHQGHHHVHHFRRRERAPSCHQLVERLAGDIIGDDVARAVGGHAFAHIDDVGVLDACQLPRRRQKGGEAGHELVTRLRAGGRYLFALPHRQSRREVLLHEHARIAGPRRVLDACHAQVRGLDDGVGVEKPMPRRKRV